MDKLIRHIEAAQRDVAEFSAAGCSCLARERLRDLNFLRRVLLGFAPWPAAFGPMTGR